MYVFMGGIDCSNYRGISLFNSYVQNFIPLPLGKANSMCRGSVDFDVTGQITNLTFCIRQVFEKKRAYGKAVYQLCNIFRKPTNKIGGRSFMIF